MYPSTQCIHQLLLEISICSLWSDWSQTWKMSGVMFDFAPWWSAVTNWIPFLSQEDSGFVSKVVRKVEVNSWRRARFPETWPKGRWTSSRSSCCPSARRSPTARRRSSSGPATSASRALPSCPLRWPSWSTSTRTPTTNACARSRPSVSRLPLPTSAPSWPVRRVIIFFYLPRDVYWFLTTSPALWTFLALHSTID